jgi:hypothetical protein
MNFVSIYGNRRMTPIEIVLRRGEGEKRMMGGGKCKIYGKHLYKCYSVSPWTTIVC